MTIFVELHVNPKRACKPWSAAIPNEMSSSIFSPIQTHKREKLEKVSWPLNLEKYLYDISTSSQMCRTYFLSIKVSLQRVVDVEKPFTRHSFTKLFLMRRKIEKKNQLGKWSEATESIEILQKIDQLQRGSNTKYNL